MQDAEEVALGVLHVHQPAVTSTGATSIGVWEPSVAAALRDAGLTPAQAKAAAERLVEENGSDDYTDGDPIYSVCNRDTRIEDIMKAAEGDE